MLAKWRWSIDLIAARATLGDEAVAAEGRLREIERLEPAERLELAERLESAGRCDRVGLARTGVSLMTVVTLRGGGAALARAACARLSRPANTMMTATPAPSSSAAMTPARAMIRPRWPRPPPSGCGCCWTGTGGGP